MDSIEILRSLEYSFSGLPYPYQRDFYRAIADKEYEDYLDSREKKWNDLTKNELKEHYDFILFLDEDVIVYYLPAHIKLILENEKDEYFIDMCAETLFFLMSNFNFALLNTDQLRVFCKFSEYCRDVIYPNIGLLDDEVLQALLQAQEQIKSRM